MIRGFQIRALRVIGKGKTPAEVTFTAGFNVVAGASNTGKSYILQCLDFMLGGSKKPKKIAESIGYESVQIELEARDGRIHRLERSLTGNDFRHAILTPAGHVEERILGAKHHADDPETVSALLLSLCGGWGQKIRQSQAGKTRTLSFRDLAPLVLVDETRIITEESPILSGQYTTKTEEISVFKLLLTGVDDSSVILKETLKESKVKQKTQIEVFDRLIAELEKEIRDLDNEPTTAGNRREKIDLTVANRTETLTAAQQEIESQETTRKEAWERANNIERRRRTTAELRSRFMLLESHYKNDLGRLQAVIELDHYFSQLQQVRCPLCGASSDEHDLSIHQETPPDYLDSVRRACRAESAKIKTLMEDLVGTGSQLDSEIAELSILHQQQAAVFEVATREITARLAPVTRQYQLELTEMLGLRDRLAEVEVLQGRLNTLIKERDRIANIKWKTEPKEPNSAVLFPQAVEAFTLEVQALLKAWKYPGLTRVTFDTEKTDIIISGKDRASEGKGFRAIGYAAFLTGLLDYCARAEPELPHPGTIVLDSPLVTYKRRDTEPGEEIPEDVTTAFYTSLVSIPTDRQIIVLENNDPPEELRDKINYLHFSRSAVGRYGFFPKTETGTANPSS